MLKLFPVGCAHSQVSGCKRRSICQALNTDRWPWHSPSCCVPALAASHPCAPTNACCGGDRCWGLSAPVVNTPEQNQPWVSLFLSLSPESSGPVCFNGLQDGLTLLGHQEGPRLSMSSYVSSNSLKQLLCSLAGQWGKPYQGLKCCFMGLWVDLIGFASARAAKPRALPWEVSTEKSWLA